MLRKHFGFDNEPNPTTGLAQLFQTDAEFVDKIRTTFRCTRFFIIGSRRSSAAYQLTSDVPTHSRGWQSIHGLSDSSGKVNKSFNQLIGRQRFLLQPIYNF